MVMELGRLLVALSLCNDIFLLGFLLFLLFSVIFFHWKLWFASH
jgi:hypothetical protein